MGAGLAFAPMRAESETPITVFVKLSYWEAYCSAVRLTARVLRHFLYGIAVFGAVWLGGVVLVAMRPSTDADWQQILLQTKPLSWVFVIAAAIVFVLPLLSAAKVKSEPRYKNGLSYSFRDAGIRIETYVATADLKWVVVQTAKETSSAFLLFINTNAAYMLPKRCFEDPAQVAAFRELVRGQVVKANLLNA